MSSSKMLRALMCGALFLLAQLPAYAAITHVGTGSGGATSGASFSVTANQTPTSGDVLVIAIFASSNQTVTPPANWVSDVQPAANASMYLGHCIVTASACNSTSVGTFSFGASQGYCYAYEEFSGVSASPLQAAKPIQLFAGSVTSPSYTVTPSAYPAGIFAVFGGSDNRTSLTAGAGYTRGITGTDGSHAWCYDEWTSADIASGNSNVSGTFGSTGTHNEFLGAMVLNSGSAASTSSSNRMMMGCCK